jgi:hypothetical protein
VPGPTGSTGSTGATGPTGATPTLKTINGISLIGAGNVAIAGGRTRNIQILGSYNPPQSWSGLTNTVLNLGDLLTLSFPIDISLLVESPTSNLVLRMYLSSSPTTVAPGAQQIGQATLGPGTIRLGKFVRTLYSSFVYSYSGEETSYDWYWLGYTNSNDISDASSVSGSSGNASYYFYDYWEGTQYGNNYLVIQIPNGLYAWNLNVQSGT